MNLLVALLYQSNPNLMSRNKLSLHAAAERGDLGTARRELFAQGSRHGGLLHRAIVTWNIDLVRFLVNKRAYDYEDEPLNIAIIWGKSNMFEFMGLAAPKEVQR